MCFRIGMQQGPQHFIWPLVLGRWQWFSGCCQWALEPKTRRTVGQFLPTMPQRKATSPVWSCWFTRHQGKTITMYSSLSSAMILFSNKAIVALTSQLSVVCWLNTICTLLYNVNIIDIAPFWQGDKSVHIVKGWSKSLVGRAFPCPTAGKADFSIPVSY